MPGYMVELLLTGRPVLLVGGGRVARRKLTGLQAAGARVRVVAPELCEALAGLVREGRLDWVDAPYTPDQLVVEPRPLLVFAATSTAELNCRIAADCSRAGLWCNAADSGSDAMFNVAAMLHRGQLTIGVASGGASPALSRVLKEELDRLLDPGWEALVEAFAALRPEVAAVLPAGDMRESFWRAAAQAAWQEGRQHDSQAKDWLQSRLRAAMAAEGSRS
ncbi:MAG: bifunctional precorrin-2 dehydrogenase/sirohydrochlorin ferrochelatase [Magnetococcus sp. WYHC-3]